MPVGRGRVQVRPLVGQLNLIINSIFFFFNNYIVYFQPYKATIDQLMNNIKIKIFYSYSHEDEELRNKLEQHLSMLRNSGYIDEWTDRKILAGTEWDGEIKKELDEANIILLLVSSAFLASKYCFDIEVRRAIELHELEQSKIIPIILRDCDWTSAPFAKIMALPTDGKPIQSKHWGYIDEALTNVAKGLRRVIEELKEEKSLLIKTPSISIEQDRTIEQAVELLKQESQKLNYRSSREDIERLDKIRREVYQGIFGDVDEKINNTISLKEIIPTILFDKIYTLETVDNYTKLEIHKIRDDKATYKWYERAVLVSALSLSIINFKKFDQKKADLLIDILTDFEDGVWERALTGLVLSLLYHKNRWERFANLKKRLLTLKDIEKVQNGLDKIECVLRNELFKDHIYRKETIKQMFSKNPLFQKPINCFLPFYEGNKLLEQALDNNTSNVDTEEFTQWLNTLPLIDSYKYALCSGLSDGTTIKKILTNREHYETVNKIRQASYFYPYQNLISEYYNFFSFYPKKLVDDIFATQLSITKTKLKSIILNRVHELFNTAALLREENRYDEAISKLLELIKLEPNHINGLWQIAICYSERESPDYSLALKYHLRFNEVIIDDKENLIRIAMCHRELKQFDEAISFHEKFKKKFGSNNDNIFELGTCYSDLKEHEKALNVLLEIKEADTPFLIRVYINISFCFSELGKKEKSIEYLLKVLELDPKHENALVSISIEYEETEEINEALKYAKEFHEFYPENNIIFPHLGRLYLIGNSDLIMAKTHLIKALEKEKDKSTIYGNLAHIALCQSDEHKAISLYKQCILLMNSSEEFEEKYNKDLKYLKQYGVAEEKYNKIKEEVIEYWKSQRENQS